MPKRTQEELAVLQELILSNLTNVRMIILYGSYARGKYVIWDETYDERGVTTYYQSDLGYESQHAVKRQSAYHQLIEYHA